MSQSSDQTHVSDVNNERTGHADWTLLQADFKRSGQWPKCGTRLARDTGGKGQEAKSSFGRK